MKQIIYLLAIFVFSGLFLTRPSFAMEKIPESSASLKLAFEDRKSIYNDPRVYILKSFLAQHNSTLSAYAEEIVLNADKYQIPWTLVTAISGVESTFCKRIPLASANCWGWENGKTRFRNYPEAIDIVSRILKEDYFAWGLNTPFKIGPVYAPPTSSWGWKVKFFMDKIENYLPPPTSKQFLIG